MKDDKLTLTVPGQPSYTLENIGGRRYKLGAPAPDGFFATFRPLQGDPTGTELFLQQPQGDIVLPRRPVTTINDEAPKKDAAAADSSLISTDELLAKMIAAFGGEENLRKHKSSVMQVQVDLENQGVQAKGTMSARVPNLTGSEMTFMALGKTIGTQISFFDGSDGGEVSSFGSPNNFSGKRLEDIRAGSDFYDVLNWKTNYKTIKVKKIAKVGDEDAYVVERRSEKGTPITDYISTKTFLPLKRDSLIVSDTLSIELPLTQTFSDYRNVNGVMVPFQTTANTLTNGDVVLRVVDVKFDVDIPDTVFHKPANPPKRTDQ
jgi:zinc protease